ncbi:MAG: hypothetical protein IT162_17885, partial [Bryobacterales bacterium]|nr:hypothetical protein [Bryobacterales bacterium]
MRLLSLALLSAAAATVAHAQSYYTYTDTFASYNSAAWQYPLGGGLTFSGSGLGTNGSYAYLYNPSFYSGRQEVRATLTNNGLGAELWLAMNVSGTSVTSGFVVSLQQGGFGNSPLARITQWLGGSPTDIASFSYTPASPTVVRAILYPGSIRVEIGSTVQTVSASTFMGSPGVGLNPAWSTNTFITQAQLASADTTAPANVSGLTGSGTTSEVQLQWTGVSDNAGGSGLYRYNILRNGVSYASTSSTSFIDSAVSPATTYTYVVKSEDYQGNESSGTTVVVSTGSSSGASDPHAPRQTGVRPLGSYWGAAGENIDMRSGNLNFSLPLLKAQGRHGVSLALGLSYNSQNWRKNGANTFKIGADVGYGFGWRLAAGSIFPVWNGGNFSHYIFTDATGAEYRLDVNEGGIWWSKEGLYVAYDPGTFRVRFMDGTFWTMGSISAGTEQDAGTRYPTRVTDSNGNFLELTYRAGISQGSGNTSARVSTITDIRSAPNPAYVFNYDNDPNLPRLTSIAAQIPTGENYSFTYSAPATLYSPFTPQVAFDTNARMLQTVTVTGPNLVHTFEYGSNGAGEMSRVILPYQGDLRWYHDSFAYPNGQTLREVRYRYLTKQAGAATTTYTLQYDTAAANNVHAWGMVDDPNGISRKQWTFNSASPTDPYFGLVNLQQDIDKATSTAKNTTAFTWTADGRGNRFITASLSTIDPGTAYQKQLKSEQMLDLYGNITWSKAYDFNNLTTPKMTYNYSYLTGANYAQRFIFNRKTAGPYSGATYDSYPGDQLTARTGLLLHDSVNYPATMIYRGNATNAGTYGGYGASGTYDMTGFSTSSTNGQTTTTATPDSKNVAAAAITTNSSFSTTTAFNSIYQLTSVNGPNGASVTMAYNPDSRPQWTTGPHGQTTMFYYYDSLRMKQSATANRWTKTWFDGLGRTIKEEAGTGTTTVSIVDTEYDSCGCSPLGKVKRVSRPYAPGGTVYWTTYTYDSQGRVVNVAQPNNAGTTTYLYQGSTTRVTSPANKWKIHEVDSSGNLVKVTEPNPAGGADYITNYTYDLKNRLTQVSMPRPTGTQTRTFTYDSNDKVLTATNPETGTVTNTYEASTGLLQHKIDAKSNKVAYTYDTYKRVTEIKRYEWVCTGGGQWQQGCAGSHVERPEQGTKFYYDSNSFVGGWATNLSGRLAAVETFSKRGGAAWNAPGGGTAWTTMTFREMYSYSTGGLMLKKRLA